MQSKKRHKEERASIFASFDALKGFREYLKKKERVVVSRRELSEDECSELNWKINQLNVGDIITVIYYNSGDYIKLEGMVSKFDLEFSKTITIVRTDINVKDIVFIDTGSKERL